MFTFVNQFISLSNIAWSSDSKYIIVPVNNSTLQIWDVFTGQKRLAFTTDVPSPYSLLWSPDDTRIAVQAEHFADTSNGGIDCAGVASRLNTTFLLAPQKLRESWQQY